MLTDALGSILALTDSTGAVQTEYTYEPFGKATVTGSANTSSYLYTGRESDGTGLVYYRSRYYHPELQRFISEDAWKPARMKGKNLYAYVKNNPLRYTDPLGFYEDDDDGPDSPPPPPPRKDEPEPDPPDPDGVKSWEEAAVPTLPRIPRVIPKQRPPIPKSPTEPPGPGWEWRGNGPPGSSEGNWYNPKTGESLHPDPYHPPPIGPHYDWKAPDGNWYRIYPDGSTVPKIII